VILGLKAKFPATASFEKVSKNKSNIDKQPEVALWLPKPEVYYISESMPDIIKIPTANVGFWTQATSKKVSKRFQ